MTGPLGTLRRGVRRSLVATARVAVHHPKSVLIAAAVLTAVCLGLAAGIELSTDVTDLLPDDLPSARRLRALIGRYGSAEPLAIAISGAGGPDVEQRIDLALAIRDRLEEDPDLVPVAGLFGEDPFALLAGPQAEALLLYLEPEEIESFAARLTPAGIDAAVARNLERLRSPLGPLATRLLRDDPLGLVPAAMRHIEALKGRLRIVPRDGVLVTEDDAYVVLLVRLSGSTQDVRFVRAVLDRLERVAREELDAAGLEGTAGVGPAPAGAAPGAVRVGFTGAPAILADYKAILAHDIRSISGVAFVAVMLLFLAAFRRPLGVLIAGVPLAAGIAWTLGFARLAIGHLNVFTAGSIAILCGLGIDFTIHLYNRYLEEVHAGRDMLEAFEAAHGETGLGILAAAATTAWAFLAAGLSSFPGLRDLGRLCAAGMALSLAASLLLVPALTALAARWRPARDRPRGLAGFGLGPLLALVVRHPRRVVLVAAAATVALAVPALRARLDEDFRRFRPSGAPSIRLQTELAKRIGTSLQPVLALVPGSDEASLLDRCERVQRAFDPLVREEEGPLAAVMSPARLVPPPSRQQRALATLRRLRAGGLDPASVRDELLRALRRHGFRIDEHAEAAAARIERVLSRDRPLTLAEASRGPLGPMLADLLLEEDGVREGVVSCYPRPAVATRDLVGGLRAALASSGVPATLIGGRVLSQDIKPMVLRDGTRAVVLSAAGVLAILLLSFRRPLLVLLTFLPLIGGVVASVGLMAAFGVDFNLVSVSVLPLILGVGIDNGIHVVHRFLHHSSEDLVDVFRHTGRGIVMTSLTTIVGFGALVFADYPGLISSGVLAILGVGATLVTAVTLLPALLEIVRVRNRAGRPGAVSGPRGRAAGG
ncbi:MAG: hypothetical protein D6718_05025 [Acidobacteria bacterium]|nr:MAG: hypothetical protein D6718_05025 [Acidobacteriota bacterium]